MAITGGGGSVRLVDIAVDIENSSKPSGTVYYSGWLPVEKLDMGNWGILEKKWTIICIHKQ